MKQHFNQKGSDYAVNKLEALIASLMCKVMHLAPHPSRPHDTGTLFVSGANAYKPAAEYDGMGGVMMMETMVGCAMVSEVMDLSDAVSTVYTDRSVSCCFNHSARRSNAMAAYRGDLPRRIQIEAFIAVCLRELYAMRGYALQYELRLSA